jgi:hypothetical protein
MDHVTQLLSALGQGDPHAASRLLPLVCEEPRKLAAQRAVKDPLSSQAVIRFTNGYNGSMSRQILVPPGHNLSR